MMREKISKHWHITAASLLSVVMVVGAYFLARGVESPQVAQASTETALLQAIATKDSSGDGLPDWEKTLYGIPVNATTTDYFHLGMTDGEAVAKGLIVPKAAVNVPVATSSPIGLSASGLPAAPAEGTLTATFAKNFFTFFIAAKQANGGADLSETQMNDVANQSLASIAPLVAAISNYKSAQDLSVSGSGNDAMKAFAISAEAVLLKNTADASSTALGYLKVALANGDQTAFAHIASLSRMFADSAAGLSVLPVPQELVSEDLLLINSLMRMSRIDDDLTRANTDPLVAILALQQYQTVATSLGEAFINIGQAYANAGISLSPGAPGASFVNVIANVTASQQTATQIP